jgi:hypothetical protein
MITAAAMSIVWRIVVGLGGSLFGTWGAGALWFDGPSARPLAGLLAATFFVTIAGLSWSRRPTRHMTALVLGVALLLWWFAIPPRNDRDWQPDVARPATATFDDDLVTIENVRDFRYRSTTDFDERWGTRTIALDDVEGLDLFVAYWGSPWIAHTILSWQLADAAPLAISIETRKERGEAYSAIAGFFRQYELYYVVASEDDVVALRTNHRGDDVYLYRLGGTPEEARRLLVSYLRRIDHLAHEPAWYNAFSHNCTTTIRLHAIEIGIDRPWDWRLLVNGLGPEMLYERGSIAHDRPFEEIRAASYVNERGRAGGDGPGYSERIRVGLPARPAPIP